MVFRPGVSPFPINLNDGTVAVDELCRCGHARSQHNHAAGGLAWGHGDCREGLPIGARGERPSSPGAMCPCSKFTWLSFVIGKCS